VSQLIGQQLLVDKQGDAYGFVKNVGEKFLSGAFPLRVHDNNKGVTKPNMGSEAMLLRCFQWKVVLLHVVGLAVHMWSGWGSNSEAEEGVSVVDTRWIHFVGPGLSEMKKVLPGLTAGIIPDKGWLQESYRTAAVWVDVGLAPGTTAATQENWGGQLLR
jgi:hypothetical protein